MFKLICSFILILQLFSTSIHGQTFNLGKFSIGDSRIQIDLNDFLIRNSNSNIIARWVPDSVQWIRNENNLLVPRALLKILIKNNESNVHIDYKHSIIIPLKKQDQIFETQIYIDLFNPGVTQIISNNESIDKIVIEAQAAKNARSKQLIDYSCSAYDLKIDGIDTEYLSIGCKMKQLQKKGKIYPLLEITMSSTNLKTINNSLPPYTIYLQDNSPVEINIKGADQKIRTLKIKATLPSRLYRLKTALGFGPYIYQTEYLNNDQAANMAASFMLYAKYDLTETASLKGFDALLYSKTLFNNSGLYFSYDLAEAFDGRVLLNALLGFQGLHYRYSKSDTTEFHLIYPQGFELIYKHAFIENYHMTYGMFLSTGEHKYTNAWLRYGKRGFLELNYIEWGLARSHIQMWGLSIGLPFFSAF